MRLIRIYAFVVFVVIAFPVYVSAWDVVTVTNGEWPPYFSPRFKHGGVGTLLCTNSFHLEGVSVEYTYLPWKRALETVRQCDFDAALGWRKTERLQESFLYSDPLMDHELVFFHRLGSGFDWHTLDDIGHLRIGATLGYSWVKSMQDAAARHGGTVEIAPTDTSNFAKLIAGRIDVFPCSRAVGYYLLRTEFLPGAADSIHHHPRMIDAGTLYLLVSKKHPHGQSIIDRFNKGLAALRESGKYDQYMEESLLGEYMPAIH